MMAASSGLFPRFPRFTLHPRCNGFHKSMERIGIEPMTSWLQTRRSPS
jgi:hypothetical protein